MGKAASPAMEASCRKASHQTGDHCDIHSVQDEAGHGQYRPDLQMGSDPDCTGEPYIISPNLLDSTFALNDSAPYGGMDSHCAFVCSIDRALAVPLAPEESVFCLVSSAR